ncbi:MAG: ParB/RepB/Spo0J family partition protein [Gammaproteobacteria bacterium]|nr:ParB/RepB/Spo0J family partition protein [Gammaproteobacteria bacterium]
MDLKEKIAQKREELSNDLSGSKGSQQSAQIIEYIPQDQQDPDAFVLLASQIEVKAQGRKTFEDLDELASNIKAVGQLQPVVVKQIEEHRYRLVAGERRYRAISQILKQDTIRVTIRRVHESEADTRFVQISENTKREDYLPLELAAELSDLKIETGFTTEQVATRIGKSKGFVSKYINLLHAPDEVTLAIKNGDVSATAWFNNKDRVLQQLKESPSGSVPPKTKHRTSTIAVSLDAAKDMARILQLLADKNGLANIDVDLTGAVTKKQLQAILTSRTTEVLESL